MKKTLSLFAVAGVLCLSGVQQANAFSWSSLNPAYWGHCPKCEKKKKDCGCKKKVDKDCPCTTGAAAPCDPCQKEVTQSKPCDPCAKKTPCNPCKKEVAQPKPCDPCDKLQREMQNR